MRIVCPSCQAAYEVPDKLLSGSPRKVRCARCGENWVPEPVPAPTPAAMPDAASPTDDLPEATPHDPHPAPPEPEPDLPTPPPVLITPTSSPNVAPRAAEKLLPAGGHADDATPGGRRLLVVTGVLWLASLATLATAAWATFAFRDDIMAAWAPSRRLYSLLGLG